MDEAERLQRWLAAKEEPQPLDDTSVEWLAQLRMLRHDLDMLRQARERGYGRDVTGMSREGRETPGYAGVDRAEPGSPKSVD